MNDAVIVVSTPRSGSSWLSRILRGHPDLQVYTHNTNSTQVLYLLYPFKTFNPFGDDRIGTGGLADRLLNGLRVRVAASYYDSPTPERLVVLASPTNVEFLPLLKNVFPAARYVHLRRNPLDVIASFRSFLAENGKSGVARRFVEYKHQGYSKASARVLAHLFHTMRWLRIDHPGYIGTRPVGFQEAAGLPLLEFLCWYYFRLEEQIARALECVSDERKHYLTYESLVTNHETELRRLLQFLGVPVLDEHISTTAAGIRTGGLGRHKKLFDDSELETVKRYIELHHPAVLEEALAGA